MTDLPTITDRQTLDGERTSFTLTEFESTTADDNDRRYLLNIASRGSTVGINLHFTAEEWGQFRAMIADFGPMQRRPFDQAEFDAFRADPKRQALVSRILDVMGVDEDKFGVPTPEDDREDFDASSVEADPMAYQRREGGPDLPPWADR